MSSRLNSFIKALLKLTRIDAINVELRPVVLQTTISSMKHKHKHKHSLQGHNISVVQMDTRLEALLIAY